MFISLIAALWYGQGDATSIFLSALITLSVGTLLRFAIRPQKIDIDRRLGILIVASIWLIMTFFGTLPYLIGGYAKDFSTAALETMSGFTTTGASNLDDLEALPKGILLWRSLTHWIGGVGIVVIVISFIPSIGGGAMALFSAESAGPSKTKISPHIGTTGKIICGVYFVLTAICCTVYTLCGMDFLTPSTMPFPPLPRADIPQKFFCRRILTAFAVYDDTFHDSRRNKLHLDILLLQRTILPPEKERRI